MRQAHLLSQTTVGCAILDEAFEQVELVPYGKNRKDVASRLRAALAEVEAQADAQEVCNYEDGDETNEEKEMKEEEEMEAEHEAVKVEED